MARVTWYGTLTFGLVSVPVGLTLAKGADEKPTFRLVHKGCGEPIKQVRRCAKHDVELTTDDIAKGYEYAKDQIVEVDPSDLEALEEASSRSIEIHSFVSDDEVDPMLFDRSYHLVPAKEEPQRKGYALLATAMRASDVWAVATFAKDGRDHLGVVRERDGLLMLHSLCFAEDVRDVDELHGMMAGVKVNKAETDLALQIVENMKARFDHDAFHPQHRERVREHVASLLKGVKPKKAAPPKQTNVDVLDALKASVAATKKKPATTARKTRAKATK